LFLFFPKSAFPDWGCGFSKDAAYTWTFTVVGKGTVIEIEALKSTFEGGGDTYWKEGTKLNHYQWYICIFIASELLGFTCMSALTMNKKLQYLMKLNC